MPRKDLTGQVFGRLTVLRLVFVNRKRNAIWACRCERGRETESFGYNLKSGNTSSCGCLRREVTAETSTTHGHSKANTPEYESWSAMLARVRAKSGRKYRDYGARGITVCERWLAFENFLADMGARPAGTTLDRVNNDGNYEPGNCRWATDSEQVGNRRYLGRRSHPELAGATSSNSEQRPGEVGT